MNSFLLIRKWIGTLGRRIEHLMEPMNSLQKRIDIIEQRRYDDPGDYTEPRMWFSIFEGELPLGECPEADCTVSINICMECRHNVEIKDGWVRCSYKECHDVDGDV